MKRKAVFQVIVMLLFLVISMSAYAQPGPGKDPDAPKGEMCAGGNNTITSTLLGTSYQWQINTGSGFANISDNVYYSGTNTKTLKLTKIPSSWYGYILKVIVDGGKSETFPLTFVNDWTGAAGSTAWEDGGNWGCRVVPDTNTDVGIYSGAVILSSNVACRSLRIDPTASFTVSPGFILTILH